MTALMERPELYQPGPEGSTKATGIPLRDQHGDTPAMAALSVKRMALSVMQFSEASELGNVGIVKLEPGGKLDQPPLDGWTRFYAVLMATGGCMVSAGDEAVKMLSGDVWWVDGKEERAIRNNSQDDMIFMQIDVRIDK